MEFHFTITVRKYAYAALLVASSSWPAFGQCTGVFPANTLCGNLSGSPAPPSAFAASGTIVGPGTSTIGGLPTWANATGTQLQDAAGGSINGTYTFANTTASTTPTTGAVKFSGGVGIAGDLFVQGTAGLNNTGGIQLVNSYAAGLRMHVVNSSNSSGAAVGFDSDIGTTPNAFAHFGIVNVGGTLVGLLNFGAGIPTAQIQMGGTQVIGLTQGGGIQIGGPSGGDKGAGTSNAATGYFVNGNGPMLATNPTVQNFTTGSGTYTTPAGVKWIKVRGCGAGGGGGGTGNTTGPSGGTGGNTTFGTTLLVGNGGVGGTGSTSGTSVGGGAGGTASIGAAIGVSFSGATGSPGSANGTGAGSPFVGSTPGATGTANGNAPPANTCAGGSGATASTLGAGGGGAGGYFDAIINSPVATYSYAVGASAAGGIGTGINAQTGGASAAGIITVEEHYNY